MSREAESIAKKITYHRHDRVALMRGLSIPEQSAILQAVSPYVQQQILGALSNQEIIDILDHLDLQTAQRLVTCLKDQKRRDKIVSQLKTDIKDKVEYFLRFHPKATFSLVHFNYVFIPAVTTIKEASKIIETHYDETGKFPEILVHEAGMLQGEVPMSVLVRERSSLPLGKFAQPLTTITYQAEVSEIIETVTHSGKRKVVVLDHDGSVLGLIYADDALELFGHIPAESLYSLAGVDSSERPFDSAWRKFKHRYVWLVINLATGFLAGGVILAFQDTVDALTILSVYIPIVAGMGTNAASQTFAVMLRGITLGSITLKNAWPAIKGEIYAASMTGSLVGLLAALVSVLYNRDPFLGLVVAMSIVGVHIVAGFFGAFIPLLLKRFGKDPAATSMIFISTTTDVFGLLLLLGLGALILL